MRRRRDPVPARRVPVALASLAMVVAACTGGSDGEPPPSVVTTTTVVAPPRVNDEVLRIGALIPSGDSAVGTSVTSSLERAVTAVNEAGGVLGREVELFPVEEGPTAASAALAIEQLAEQGVDALIGPTSSNRAIGALDEAVADGIVTCSATATAIALDDYPDDDLFFRSIATDSLQAVAIASEAQATGASEVVIMHVDDAYGRPYAEAVEEALGSSIGVDTIPIAVDDVDLTAGLDVLQEENPQTLVMLGNGDDIARFLEAIDQRGDIDVSKIIVNDDARNAAGRAAVTALDSSIRERITVVAPQITLPDDDTPFWPQIIDCVNLIALATVQAGSDSPAVIAGQMASVSDGGIRCSDFASCSNLLDAGEQINYDGPTGITLLSSQGDPSRAFFELSRFESDGSDRVERRETYQF